MRPWILSQISGRKISKSFRTSHVQKVFMEIFQTFQETKFQNIIYGFFWNISGSNVWTCTRGLSQISQRKISKPSSWNIFRNSRPSHVQNVFVEHFQQLGEKSEPQSWNITKISGSKICITSLLPFHEISARKKASKYSRRYVSKWFNQKLLAVMRQTDRYREQLSLICETPGRKTSECPWYNFQKNTCNFNCLTKNLENRWIVHFNKFPKFLFPK